MRDHEDAETAPPQAVEQVEDARAHRHVEHRDGLVGDQQLRLEHERRGDRDALPLAAGELVRKRSRNSSAGERPARSSASRTRSVRSSRVPMRWITSGSATVSRTR